MSASERETAITTEINMRVYLLLQISVLLWAGMELFLTALRLIS